MYDRRMPQQRGYRDACGLAHAMDLVGERWAMLVIRELLFGPKRFTDLRRSLPAASPNALADRLRELSEIGVVRRRRLLPPAASWVYELTDWGRELEPIVVALGAWAVRSGLHEGTGHLSASSVMLTIRTYFRAETAGSGTLDVRLVDNKNEDRFGVWLDDHSADVRHEPPARPDAVILSDAATLSDAFGDRRVLRKAINEGTITVNGNQRLAARLIAGVNVPPPAPAESRR